MDFQSRARILEYRSSLLRHEMVVISIVIIILVRERVHELGSGRKAKIGWNQGVPIESIRESTLYGHEIRVYGRTDGGTNQVTNRSN